MVDTMLHTLQEMAEKEGFNIKVSKNEKEGFKGTWIVAVNDFPFIYNISDEELAKVYQTAFNLLLAIKYKNIVL